MNYFKPTLRKVIGLLVFSIFFEIFAIGLLIAGADMGNESVVIFSVVLAPAVLLSNIQFIHNSLALNFLIEFIYIYIVFSSIEFLIAKIKNGQRSS